MLKNNPLKKTLKTSARLIFISFIIFLLSACSELDTHDPIYRFQATDELYSTAIRWGEWHTVFKLMQANPDKPNSKITPPSEEQIEHLTSFKVTHVETLNTGIIEEEKSARTIYQIEYHPKNSSVIKKLLHTVYWWYDKKSNQWFTDTPLPRQFAIPKHKTIKWSPE